MLYSVTLKITTTYTLPIEAADVDEAKELAFDMPIDDINDSRAIGIADLVVEREVTEVVEAEQGLDPVEEFLAGQEDEDEDDMPPQDDDDPSQDYGF